MAGVVGVMTDEQAGKLLKAILTYVNGTDPEFDDPVAMVAFQPVRMQLERDHQSYVNTVIRNRENGRKGGRPKKTQENPVGYLGNPSKPKKADTDTDTDNDIDKDNVKDIILNNKSWIEQICMQKRKDYRVIYNYLNGFLDNLILQGEIDKGEKEIKKHFINWLKIELSKNSSKSNNATSKIVF